MVVKKLFSKFSNARKAKKEAATKAASKAKTEVVEVIKEEVSEVIGAPALADVKDDAEEDVAPVLVEEAPVVVEETPVVAEEVQPVEDSTPEDEETEREEAPYTAAVEDAKDEVATLNTEVTGDSEHADTSDLNKADSMKDRAYEKSDESIPSTGLLCCV